MKKRNITLIILLAIIIIGFIKQDNIKKFFVHKRYYSGLVFVGLAKPRYSFNGYFYKAFEQEGIDFTKQNEEIINDSLNKLLDKDLPLSDKPIIPTITHSAFFTFSPNKINDYYIENLKSNFKKLDNLDPNIPWIHYLWTNNPDVFPQEFKNKDNIKIKSIDEFKNNKLYPYLETSLNNGKETKAYLSESADTISYLILQKYGGIYTDMDYEIYNPLYLYNLMKKFNLMVGRGTVEIKSIFLSGFVATTADHPVINEALRLLYRNYSLTPDTPDYIKYPYAEVERIHSNGPPLFSMAYFNKYNNNGNSDIILPSWMIYNQKLIRKKNKYCPTSKISKEDVITSNINLMSLIEEYTATVEIDVDTNEKASKQYQNIYYSNKYKNDFPIIGADMGCGSWTEGYNLPKLYYFNIPYFNELKK